MKKLIGITMAAALAFSAAVTASADGNITVNGKTYQPINKRLVKRGLSSEYVFSVVERVKKNETVSFEVIAYDAGNFASEAKSLQG